MKRKQGKIVFYDGTPSASASATAESKRPAPAAPPAETAVQPDDSNVASKKAPVSLPTGVDTTVLMQTKHTLQEDELFSEDEQALNRFISLHPMLSLESTSAKTLELLSSVFKSTPSFSVDSLPIIPKSHDDLFLRPANKEMGERDCVCESKCMASFLATLRFGKGSKYEFVCTEFLTPAEDAAFRSSRTLPKRRKKCLLCARYYTSYVYYRSRVDPAFDLASIPACPQAFRNCSERADGDDGDAEQQQQLARELLTHSSKVAVDDGYRADALLFVDEEYVNRKAARSSPMSSLLFQPVVRFDSSHYEFRVSESGSPFIVQFANSGASSKLFGEPPPGTGRPAGEEARP